VLILQAFEFYEEMLSVRYPYPAYKQVFVDEAYTDSHICSSITIFRYLLTVALVEAIFNIIDKV